MPRVKVPIIEQEDGSDCVVACVMMVMAWAKSVFGDVAEFTYHEMKKILKWDKDGVRIENVHLLNKRKRIKRHTHQPKFTFGFATGLDLIWDEIALRRPVIVYLHQASPDGVHKHANVVIGHSPDKTKIYCNDPAMKKSITMPTGQFQDEWNALFRTTAHVMVEEQETLPLGTFTEEDE